MEPLQVPATTSSASPKLAHDVAMTELLFRGAALLLSGGACMLSISNKQTVTLSLFGVNLKQTAEFGVADGSKSLVYTSATCAVYMLLHVILILFLALHNKAIAGVTRRSGWKAWIIFLCDQTLAYALLATTAATTELGYIAKRGLQIFDWSPTCGSFGRFCVLQGVTFVCAYLGVVAFAAASGISCKHLFSSKALSRKLDDMMMLP